MRAKVAKAMRQAARKAMGKDALDRNVLLRTGELATQVQQVPYVIRSNERQSRILASGVTPTLVFARAHMGTHINDPETVRGLYRKMKKSFVKGRHYAV